GGSAGGPWGGRPTWSAGPRRILHRGRSADGRRWRSRRTARRSGAARLLRSAEPALGQAERRAGGAGDELGRVGGEHPHAPALALEDLDVGAAEPGAPPAAPSGADTT